MPTNPHNGLTLTELMTSEQLTDTGETADFCAVRKPLGASLVVSSALTFG